MTDRVRVLNLLNSNHRRGAEAFALDLATALSALHMDVRSVALTPGNDGASHNVETLPRSRGGVVRSFSAFRKMVQGSDVMIGHGGRTLMVGAIARQATRTPFVYRVIGEPMAWVDGESRLRHARVGLALRHADAVVGYVRSQTDVLVQQFGVDPARVRVIPKGIDLSAFMPATDDERREARRSLGLDGSVLADPVVAYVGALTPQKNVEQVIRSVARIPDARLVVAGAGAHEPVLRALAETAPTRVVFAGSLSDPRTVYAAADVVALTSRTEGVPTVLLEAALMGLPAVATRVGGVPETVIDEVTGLLVDLDDDPGTATALNDAIARKPEMGPCARTYGLATWDIQAVASRWLALMNDVHRTKPRSTP